MGRAFDRRYMMKDQFRLLTDYELRLIDRLLSESFPARDAIRAQVVDSLAKEIDSDGSLEIRVSDKSPPVVSKFRVPVEGWFEDEDGIHIHVLLHVVNGRLNELEIYKDDGRIIKMPDPEQLAIFTPE